MTLTLCDGTAFCSCSSPRFVLFQAALTTKEDESVLGPFDAVFVTTLWWSLGPCKLNCVCVWAVRLSVVEVEFALVRQVEVVSLTG